MLSWATVRQRNVRRGLIRVPWLVAWAPVIPFLGYWFSTFLIYHAGPFVNKGLAMETYAYLFVAVGMFVLSYYLQVGRLREERKVSSRDLMLAYKILRVTSVLAFLGAFGMVIDRVQTGAGSLERTFHDTENVRGDLADSTSVITTLSVIPQMTDLVALGAYFFCLGYGLRIQKKIHVLIALTQALALFDSVLTASRGNFFWLGMYILFFFVVNKRVSLERFCWASVFKGETNIGDLRLRRDIIFFLYRT
jgi:oligosaccharide repeat unit polymerase